MTKENNSFFSKGQILTLIVATLLTGLMTFFGTSIVSSLNKVAQNEDSVLVIRTTLDSEIRPAMNNVSEALDDFEAKVDGKIGTIDASIRRLEIMINRLDVAINRLEDSR